MGTKVNSNYEDLLTFTRASKGHALRPVSYGDELVTNGDFATNSDWTLADATISGGVVSATQGTRFLAQNAGLEVGKLYYISFDYTETSSSQLRVNTTATNEGQEALITSISGTGSGTIQGVVVAEGPYIAIEARALVFTGTIDNVSVKEVLFDQPDGTLTLFEHPDNVPRVEWDADRNRLGLLVEEARTNLITHSEDFSNSSWNSNKQGISVSTDVAVAPDGTLTADKLNETATTDTHRVGFNISSVGDAVFSFFAKAGERTLVRTWAFVGGNTAGAAFNLSTGTIVREHTSGAATIKNVGNGWYRCSCTVDAASANSVVVGPVTEAVSGNANYAGEAGKGIYIWGAQLEEASFPASYIKSNSGSTTTRSADVASIPVADFGLNRSSYSMLLEAISSAPDNAAGTGNNVNNIAQLKSSGTNYSSLGIGSTSTRVNRPSLASRNNAGSVVSAGDVASLDNTFDEGLLVKFSASFDVDSGTIAGSVNGSTVFSSTGSVAGVDLPFTDLEFNNGQGAAYIKSIQYYPRRLTNAQLEALTEPRSTPTLSLTFDGLESSYTENYIHG